MCNLRETVAGDAPDFMGTAFIAILEGHQVVCIHLIGPKKVQGLFLLFMLLRSFLKSLIELFVVTVLIEFDNIRLVLDRLEISNTTYPFRIIACRIKFPIIIGAISAICLIKRRIVNIRAHITSRREWYA